jgi:21S rRNA (uridine2791-2'-O)-methyltransferase
VQESVKAFLRDPERGRARPQITFSDEEHADEVTEHELEQIDRDYIDLERRAVVEAEESPTQTRPEAEDRTVDVVLSDMSAPWPQTTGYGKRSLSNPYYRMMNTSGLSFRDHAGSMVCP